MSLLLGITISPDYVVVKAWISAMYLYLDITAEIWPFTY